MLLIEPVETRELLTQEKALVLANRGVVDAMEPQYPDTPNTVEVRSARLICTKPCGGPVDSGLVSHISHGDDAGGQMARMPPCQVGRIFLPS